MSKHGLVCVDGAACPHCRGGAFTAFCPVPLDDLSRAVAGGRVKLGDFREEATYSTVAIGPEKRSLLQDAGVRERARWAAYKRGRG